jgi:hypothetical protein
MKTEVTNDKSLVDREADEQYTAQPSNDEETDVNRERSTVTGRRISSSTEIATNIHEETRSVKEETSDTDEVSQKNVYVDDEVEMWQITGQSAKVGLTFDFAATAERDEKGSVVSVEEAADEVLTDDGRTTDSDGDEDENYDKERLSSIYDFVGSDSDASSMNAPVMLV